LRFAPLVAITDQRHSELLQKVARTNVRGLGNGDDSVDTQALESPSQDCSTGLFGVAMAPVLGQEFVGQLDVTGPMLVEVTESDKLAGEIHSERSDRDALCAAVIQDLSGHRATQVFTYNRVKPGAFEE
jgi:hypothetical protein